MDIFQRLNQEHGITVILITHERDISEYGHRIIRFRDGLVVSDQTNVNERSAGDELSALATTADPVVSELLTRSR